MADLDVQNDGVIPGDVMESDAGDTEGTMPPAKRAKLDNEKKGQPGKKNALMLLNEMKPGLVYKLVSQSGPVHAPVFVMTLDIDGQTFEATGNSKKVAKHIIAEKALASLVQHRNTSQVSQLLRQRAPGSVDFTEDIAEQSGHLFNDFVPGEDGGESHPVPAAGTPPKTEKLKHKKPKKSKPNPAPIPQGPQSKHPVMLLNELRPGIQYACTGEHANPGSNGKTFIMEVEIDGKKFQGTGNSKKLAKARAAQFALQEVYGITTAYTPGQEPVVPADATSLETQILADKIAALVNMKFSELTNNLTTPQANRKVLAGIVLSPPEGGLDALTVISVTTGTKCVGGDCISSQGTVLNDCHAEILARRCLKRYFMEQLLLHSTEETAQQSIFALLPSGKFQLKEGYGFHLYISSAPCGDSRLFTPQETDSNNKNGNNEGGLGDSPSEVKGQGEDENDRHPNRASRGQLRTKIESGEGTIPVKSGGVIQTWDGILSGERLLIMSCSDKVLRWNTLGLQGALLSNLIEPVYLASVIVGSLYHSEHLTRAAYGRLSNSAITNQLPDGYRLNFPTLCGITCSEGRQTGKKSPTIACSWLIGEPNTMETVQTAKGKLEDGNTPSRLCKLELFRLFHKVAISCASWHKGKNVQLAAEELHYSRAKNLATTYFTAKQKLYSALKSSALGCWVQKPSEEDDFYVEG